MQIAESLLDSSCGTSRFLIRRSRWNGVRDFWYPYVGSCDVDATAFTACEPAFVRARRYHEVDREPIRSHPGSTASCLQSSLRQRFVAIVLCDLVEWPDGAAD